jgi:hypothetical protein
LPSPLRLTSAIHPLLEARKIEVAFLDEATADHRHDLKDQDIRLPHNLELTRHYIVSVV